MKILNFKLVRESEVPTNTVGSGQIAAAGVGPSGEPTKKTVKAVFKRKFLELRNGR